MAAYEHTLQDARESYISSISGVCPSSSQFSKWVNEAQERLLDCGNWFSTEQLVQFCLYNGCLTLPRYVGTLLGVRQCGASIPIRNHWYNIVGPAQECCGANNIWGERDRITKEQNTACTYRPVSADGRYIRAYALKIQDYGKTIQIFGLDTNGQPLQRMENGAWVMGLKLVLQNTYAQTTIQVKSIESVLKDTTQGPVMLYEWDSVEDNMRDIARYEPSETNPRYRQYNIQGLCIANSTCETEAGDKYKKVEALVKLQYIPALQENDFLLVDNFPALKFMVQCIRQEEAGNNAKAADFERKAIRQMNLRERDKLPDMQTTIVIDTGAGLICNPI